MILLHSFLWLTTISSHWNATSLRQRPWFYSLRCLKFLEVYLVPRRWCSIMLGDLMNRSFFLFFFFFRSFISCNESFKEVCTRCGWFLLDNQGRFHRQCGIWGWPWRIYSASLGEEDSMVFLALNPARRLASSRNFQENAGSSKPERGIKEVTL